MPEQSAELVGERGPRSPEPAAMPEKPTHTYSPGLSARLVAAAFVVPGIALFVWAAGALIIQGHYVVGAAFAMAGALAATALVWLQTLRVEVDERSITRSWLFGSTVVSVGDITRLGWGGSRGTITLTIKYGKKSFIQLPSNALTRDDLREIHDDVLAKALATHGLEGAPLRPLFSELVGYVDIDEMKSMKHA
jgi:hypothetical protein